MSTGHPLVLLGDRTLFTVNVSESFTIPDTISETSPTSQYLNQPGTFDTKRPTVGGQLFLAIAGDVAGPNNTVELSAEVYPGDVIALSAVAGGKTTVTRTPRGGSAITLATITVTAVGAVIGWYA